MSTTERQDRIRAKLKSVLLDLSGFDLDELDNKATFLELGFDSLFLIQFSQAIKSNFKVKVSFRQLIEQVPSPEALVQHLDDKAKDDVLPAAAPVAASPTPAPAPEAAPVQQAAQPAPMPPAAPVPAPNFAMPSMPNPAAMTGASAEGLKALLAHQLQVMSLQLAMLTGSTPSQTAATPVMPAAAPTNGTAPPAEPGAMSKGTIIESKESLDYQEERGEIVRKRFGPYKPVKRGEGGGLTEKQQAHLDALIERFTAKTIKSKERAAEHRPHFADPRGIAGFRRIWKEMVYQITTVKSSGSKLWDIDGNEYIDLAMGFGLNLFGQSPDFVTKEVEKQLKLGVEIGPQSNLAGEVAKMLCELTGQERATFCNTGSEAVMAAIRLARLYSGKMRFVFFSGAYHGNFEQVLARPSVVGGKRRMVAAAPGVPDSIAQNALVLDYGDPACLNIIREHADEIAAVLIEPVQSSKPDIQPTEFLKELRELTRELDIAFIMDEVISGFRAAPGGAQEWFGVNADMATYGKVLGGGMPIGALAGKSKYMNGLDSGLWQYGDDSVPEEDMTFFAGTFVRHPLAMAAAKAILTRVKEAGPELQKTLTARTKALVDELNAFFEERGVPVRLLSYTSLFRFSYASDMEYIDMVYFHLLDKGIFTRGFFDNLFLSTEHTEEDIEKIKNAFKETIIELQENEFLPAYKADGLEVNGVAASTEGGPVFLAHEPPKDESQEISFVDADGTATFPLTESQTEIWLASQLGTEASCAFNEPFFMRFEGLFDANHMRKAVQTTILRHQAFHLRFSADGSNQYLVAPEPIDVPLTDLSDETQSDRDAQFEAAQARLATTVFDLAEGPLVRIEMLKMAEQDHVVLFSAHHIVCDGWSWSVLLEEINEAYNALCEGKTPELDEPARFTDYAREEIERENSEDMVDAYQFWKEQFAELPPVLDLPTNRARPSFKSFKGATVRYQFDESVYKAAKEVSSKQKVSLFTLLLSTFNILLSRLSSQNDIVVAIPSAGQLQFDDDGLVGHCVNLLPLRSKIDRKASVDSFLKQTTTAVLDAYDHQECTFGGILKHLKVPRDPSRLPLVEVNFNLDRDGTGLDFHDLSYTVAQSPKKAVNFDLFFNINEMDNGFFIDLDYNAYLFDEETIVRWVEYYQALLLNIAENPESPIAELSIQNTDDQDIFRSAAMGAEVDYPTEATTYELFELQAMATPDAVAVEYEGSSLTYKELDEYANQFAHYLGTLDVGAEVMVGVLMERSAGMLVTLLGIMKAGGAYVPMDPAYPSERIKHVIEDSGLQILLTEKALFETLDASIFPDGLNIVNLDTEWSKIARRSKKKPTNEATSENLAYVIYTSGSTGKPKGVQIEHRALVNFLTTMQVAPGMTNSDVTVNVTTLSFDISGLELYLPLISGAKVVVLSRDTVMDSNKLAEALTENEVTVMQATPATWRSLLDAGWTGKSDLKMLCGGEALPPALASELFGKGSELWNMYGPTETTIWSSIHQIDSADSVISIGTPIGNTQLYILDDMLQMVPPGSVGELYIGGDGLARGYLNRPELTEERFISNPFTDKEDDRLYKTGDLARILPDGLIECLGRNDAQVKIRGYRIELGEIDAALSEFPAISAVATSVHNDLHDEKMLVAHYTTSEKDPLAVADVKTFLRTKLPEYMIPSHLVMLDAMPLTPNGKIDRKALPAPEAQRPDLGESYEAPRTPLEETIVSTWNDVLGLEKIGVHDNFFDLGGHSLQATRVIARLRTPLQLDVPLRLFFENPTVAELAIAITELQASSENDDDIMKMIEELEGLSEEEVASLLKSGD